MAALLIQETLEKVTVVLSNLEKYLKKLEATLIKKKVKVGWFSSSVYPQTGESVASVALTQEYGETAKRIPPRPFMRPTIDSKKNAWANQIGNMYKNGASIDSALETTALTMEGDIRSAIIAVKTPVLSKRTIADRLARGNSSEKPLNDTGYMLATLIGITENNDS